jgi:hypothetical protein
LLKTDSNEKRSKIGKREEDFKIKVPEELSGLFYRNYDRVLLDDSVSDKDALLLAVHVIEEQNGKAGVPYTECKGLFISWGRMKETNFHVAVHRCIRESLIERRDDLLYFLVGGIKRIRELLGQTGKAPVYIIKSGQHFTSVKLLEEFLLKEVTSSELLLCDPYISASTLHPFTVLKGKVSSIKILTTNVEDPCKFKNYIARMNKETKIYTEVKTNKKIHDRYLISGDRCWSFGTSIKDLGNKDSIIREISEIVYTLRGVFDERWNEAQTLSE